MFSTAANAPKIVTVTKLNRLARQVLESEIGQIWVSGEISNFTAAASGHWYFTLKDVKAQVRTCMFKGSNRYVKQRPKEGDRVVVRANLSLYEARGDYQLIAEHVEPEGLGQLKQAYDALKAKLSAQGLFAMDAKKPLPEQVNRIGIVTSSTGAAVHDILHVLQRRNPSIEVIIYPCLVQGEQAAPAIAAQIELANQRDEVDVLIVGRGGGSLEDLWAFNEEVVAQAMYASALPIVSAVGHEVDVTIADYVADARAPTPSAAAEMLSQDKAQVLQNLQTRIQQLQHWMNAHIKQHQHQLTLLQSELQQYHPQAKLQQLTQHLDHLYAKLQGSMQAKLVAAKQSLQQNQLRLSHNNPSRQIGQDLKQIEQLQSRLGKAQDALVQRQQSKLQHLAGMLHSVSPLSTLSRGYSITFKADKVVKSIKQIKLGDTIESQVADGKFTAKVIEANSPQK